MSESAPMSICPMAETYKGMMAKTRSGIAIMIPGFVFILLGIAVIVKPEILAWLVAITLIMLGVTLLGMATFMRRVRWRSIDR